MQRRIDGDWPGFAAAEAEPMGWGAHLVENVVGIEVSSANPDAPRLIAEALAAELGVPPEMFDVESDGTGVELLATGWVEGVVTTADGSKLRPNDYEIDGDPATIGYCGGGDIGYGVAGDGSFRIPCKVGEYTMRVWDYRHREVVILGESRETVTVQEGRTSHVRIVLDP